MFKGILKDTAVYGLADFVFKFLNFATFPIYSHLFDIEEYGILALITTLGALVASVINCGLNNAVGRFYWELDGQKPKQRQLVTSGLICLCAFAIVVPILISAGAYYAQDFLQIKYEIKWFWIVLGIISIIPMQISQYCADVLRLHFSPWKFTLISSLQNVFTILFSLLFTWKWQMGIFGFLIGSFTGALFAVFPALWMIRSDLIRNFDWKVAKQLTLYGYPFIFASLGYWLFGSMDRWMLAEQSTLEEVGIFSIAFKLVTILIFVNSAFGQAWSPYVMKIYNTHSDYRDILSKFFNLWFYFLIILGLSLSFFAPEVLILMTPQEYWPASSLVPFVAMGLVFCGTTQVTAMGISFEKKTHIISFVSWLTAGVNFLLNWTLIPYYGALGSAVATLAAYLVMTCSYLLFSQKLHPLPLEYFKLTLFVTIALIGTFIAFYLSFYPISYSLLGIKLGILCFLICCGVLLSKNLKPNVSPDISLEKSRT